MMSTSARIVEISTNGNARQRTELAEELAGAGDISRSGVFDVLDDPLVRRWARAYLLARLSSPDAESLAAAILDWPGDFQPDRRDRTTAHVVTALSDDDLHAQLPMLAGSNASSALWERLSATGAGELMQAVERIFNVGDVRTRETTLHLLVLDPYGPEYLSRDQQNAVLLKALDDPDDEIRGLAAEVVAADLPERLLARRELAPLDNSERVRTAFWQVALVYQPDQAIQEAGELALDPNQPLGARRTALLSLGENAATRTVAPVLQAILNGDDQVLANDASQLMWRHHRAPDIANAASQSPFPEVRELAERLLHPTMGSPAAGGSRPGDPTRTTQIFDEIGDSRKRDDPGGENPPG